MQTVVVVVDAFVVFPLFLCGQVDLRLMQTYADCCQVGQKTLNCAPASFLFFRSVKDNRYLGDTFRTNHGVGLMKMKAMVVQGENFARPNEKETWARAGARNFWGL